MTDDDRTQLWIVRHGATEWSESGQHTSVTDLGLLEKGRANAEKVGRRLADVEFGMVLSSPRLRAIQTAELAGFDDVTIDDDLVEWAYGPGEGLTSPEIREQIPGWRIWTHGAPKLDREGYEPGETKEHVAERLGRVVERVRSSGHRRVLAFGHGHAMRALAMVWLDAPVEFAAHFPLQTGTLCVLGYEKENPAIVRWNAEV
ncbi:histidine phosphatase family protein [Tessaracoccus flavus]|uniref:Histidine phosphatase family protein n=1 Tax=Tessaracoccus flavus TaxID=1610493 RepID=A0A1Q2CBQ2_9ACTN|nr:histidine phosphatase family protein [Tessaracoccus flavus]AQP43530.1 histidine phosphatase family protein [Tessaracoccus flavus]SDY86221.1 probable phosphoglycerate mutase [Tessaracoccus flavus]